MSDLIRRLQRLNYSIHSNGYKDSAIFEAIDAIQQAHRAAEESAKDAHRRGWEQAKREVANTCHNHRSDYGIGGEYIVDSVGRAIANLEYKEKANE